MNRVGQWRLALLVVVPCVAVDQLTKYAARTTLQERPTIHLLADTLRIQYAENPGAFLSLGANLPPEVRSWFFIGVSVLAIVALTVLLSRNAALARSSVLAYSLVLAGALGNLIDRLFMGGYVVDFLNVGVGFLRTGIFNVADMALMAGTGLVLAASFLQKDVAAPGETGGEPDTPADPPPETGGELPARPRGPSSTSTDRT